MPTATATAVIATRNRRPELCATLERLSALPERPGIIVVDNGSQDGTAQAVRHSFPRVELITLRRNQGACARNVGVRRAGTPRLGPKGRRARTIRRPQPTPPLTRALKSRPRRLP
jgi:Glycosyl transferase family 2